jgi:acetolactate synthase I/II/III large subunit
MNLQELATLAQYGINVKTVIINNGWQGMVRQWQESFYNERYSNSNMEVGMPNFPKLAEAFGIKGLLVTHEDNLAAIVAEILAYDGPVLADFRVKKDENCYPMVPPGASNSEMVGLPEPKRTQQKLERERELV